MKLIAKQKKTNLRDFLKHKGVVTDILLRRIQPEIEYVTSEPDEEDTRHTIQASIITMSKKEYNILLRNLERLDYINPSRGMGNLIREALAVVKNLEKI